MNLSIYVLEIEWQDARMVFTFTSREAAYAFAYEVENKEHRSYGAVIDWSVWPTYLNGELAIVAK